MSMHSSRAVSIGAESVPTPRSLPSRRRLEQKPTGSTGRARAKGCKVLLVEDDSAIADLYAMVLRFHGHDVTIAENGLIALDSVRSGSFDLILLDIRMPVLDGLTMLRTASSEGIVAKTPVVILSNYDDESLRQQAIQLGARDYMLKSRTIPQHLASQVSRWCS